MAISKRKRILYLCNGKYCFGFKDCKPCFQHDHPGNNREKFINECCHTLDVTYAKNGPIKGPINFLIRFKIKFRPWICFVERDIKWRKKRWKTS